VKEKALGEEVLRSVTPGQQIVKIFYDELTTLLGGNASELNLEKPARILMVGLNGAGKTTSSAKLANWLKKQGKAPAMIACDLHRPAAIEQLATLGRQINVPTYSPPLEEKDVLKSAKQAVDWLGQTPHNVEIYDTAGRQEIDEALIEEVRRLKEYLQPQEVLLVLDSTVGQNGLAQAREFTNVAGVNGIVLTKLDGTAKGGIAVAIANDLKLPIRYVGVGEGIDDLVPFDANEYVDGLFEEKW